MFRSLHGKWHESHSQRTASMSGDMWVAALGGLGLPADFSLGTQARLAPQRIVISKGRPTLRFVLIIEGELCVREGHRRLALLGPGDWCGEIGLLGRLGTNDGRATATVRTITDAHVLSLAPWEFKEMIDGFPATKSLLMASSQSRLGGNYGDFR